MGFSSRRLLLVLLDLAAILLAYNTALYFRSGYHLIVVIEQYPLLHFSFVLLPLVFYIFDLYHPFKYFKPFQTLVDILLSVVTGGIILAAISYLDRSFLLPRLTLACALLALVLFVFLIRLFYDFLFRYRFLDKRTLILGSGALALEIAKVIRETPHSGMELIGLVSESKRAKFERKNGLPIVGDIANLISLIDWYRIQLVILALNPKEEISETETMSVLLKHRVIVTSSIHLFERLTGGVPYRLLGSHYLLGLMAQVRTKVYPKVKRIIDLICASGLLVVFLPVSIATALILTLSGPGNVFFIQERIGKDGVPFRLFKFRSMTEGRKRKKTINWFGKFIRRYRIDEIPQLINVLYGDMSLIGPRPEVPYFVERSSRRIPFYDAVFAVKPGLTGWAQVMFRHATSVKDYNQKFSYNVYYLKNVSFALDLLIFLKTIRVVFLGKGK